MRRRVFLAGFDGLCPRLVESYLDRLPNFQRFCGRARWGALETVFPPVSPVAWGAAFSGQPPEAMGIYGWRKFYGEPFRAVPVTRGDIQVPTIFGHLAESGKRFAVIGFPLSNPPHPAAAVWIRGFADASIGNDDPIHPPSAREVLARHLIRLEFDVLETPRWASDYDVYVRYRQACDESRIRAAKLLFEELDLDLMMVLYTFTDNVIHTCRNEDDLISAYVEADRILGYLMDRLDEDVLLMVVSDHGVEAKRLEVALNQVLLKAGLLHLTEDVPSEKVSVKTFRNHLKRQAGLTGKDLVERCRQFAKLSFEEQRSWLWNNYMLRGTWSNIDAVRSQAVALGSYGQIYVFPDDGGRVTDRRVGEVKDTILAHRQTVTDPQTGRCLVEDVEELRPRSAPGELLPRLRVRFCPGAPLTVKTFPFGLFTPVAARRANPFRGEHTLLGFYGLRQAGIEGGEAGNHSILSCAPTILTALGIAPPAEMRAPPLPGVAAISPPPAPKPPTESKPPDKKALTPEQEAQVIERLRALGYED